MKKKNAVVKEYVIKYTGDIGKSEGNSGDFYESSGHNGMWTYHRWSPVEKAKVFPSKERAQGYKDAYTNSRVGVCVPIRGRVILKPV